jgi:thiamine-phosphate pyrophosphorylase
MSVPDFDLYLVTDRHQTRGRDLLSVLEQALDGGVTAVQLREKDLHSKALFLLAESARKLTNRYSARLFINDRIDVALAVGADGVQLGTASVRIAEARSILRPPLLLGVSVHALSEAQEAERQGGDFIVFGPVYFTPSKARYGAPQGLTPLQELLSKVSLPVYAIGGINLANLEPIKRVGARGIALISAIISSNEPSRATREILEIWRTCKK